MTDIQLTEEFDSPLGSWIGYDQYQLADRARVAGQAHRDIRVFENDTVSAPSTALLLSQHVGDLNGQTMTNLQTAIIAQRGEAWSFSSGTSNVGPDSTYSKLSILALQLVSSAITTGTSVMVKDPVDLVNGFDPTDVISVALPAFPLASITLASSFIDFTSDPTGNFTTGPTASVAFSASTIPLVAGNSEFRVPRSAFNQNGIDLSKVTGVRLRVASPTLGSSLFMRVAAMRILKPTWQYTRLDIDTRYGRLRRTPPLNGDINVDPGVWPIMWRAQSPSGPDDPRPIDGEFGVVFNTGASSQTNAFTLYFREVTEDFLTQLDLDSLTQASLVGRDQPDLGQAMYNSRVQTDLEAFDQDTLVGQEQTSLERSPDFFSASWIQFVFQWSTSGTGTVTIVDTEGNGYTVPVTGLSTYTNYIAYATLEENSARATIYALDATGNVGANIFDSGTIYDDTAFKRRKGRFGWHADLRDGDAYIDVIQQRSVAYAEYRSLPFESVTPVVGAQLFVAQSPDQQLFTALGSGLWNASSTSVDPDASRATVGRSYKVSTTGDAPNQGIQTNSFLLTDLQNSQVTFDLFYAGSSYGLRAFLLAANGARLIELLLPPIKIGQWQSIALDLPFDQSVPTGRYRFVLIEPQALAGTWWIDNVSIFSRTVAWSGRAVVDDPWRANDARWTPFRSLMNSATDGVHFPRRGNQLQVRARALSTDASISRIQFLPKYAELGNFKRTDLTQFEQAKRSYTITPSYSTASIGTRRLRFTASATFANAFAIPYGSPYVANYEWSFGDASKAIGPVVEHAYAVSGTYTVTLVATDNSGSRGTYIATVSV